MTDFVLPASLFSDEPVERDVVYNPEEVANGEEPMVVTYFLMPVTGDIDAEYTKRRGHNEQHLRFRPSQGDEGKPSIEFEPMDRVFSNERELAALKWIAGKVIKGWRPFTLTDGQVIEYTEHNLEKLSNAPQYIRPAVDEAYKINEIKTEVEEKNSET